MVFSTPVCINETGVRVDCLNNKLMSLRISIYFFGISIDCFGLSRIKKWMILIITVNLSTGIISVNSIRFLLSAYLMSESEKTVSLISLPRKM